MMFIVLGRFEDGALDAIMWMQGDDGAIREFANEAEAESYIAGFDQRQPDEQPIVDWQIVKLKI